MKSLLQLSSLALAIIMTGCATQPSTHRGLVPADQVTQFSQINALMLGQFDGGMRIGDLARYGDFGIGTFDHLDGEMILLDGAIWQAKRDGSVAQPPGKLTTPFAVVTHFDSDGKVACPPAANLTELETRLDALMPDQNVFYAIRIDVDLESITLRSVPRQEPPYKPLAEVTKQQSIWTRENAKGTMLGFRSPKWVGNLNVPGYHWHFLSADRKLGGHMFNCHIRGGTISYDQCASWLIIPNEAINATADLTKDMSHELDQVEKRRDDGAAKLK